MALSEMATAIHKTKLQKMRKMSKDIIAILCKDSTHEDCASITNALKAAIDFKSYGLWDALLYVEEHEKDGIYIAGTAEKAFIEALKSIGIDYTGPPAAPSVSFEFYANVPGMDNGNNGNGGYKYHA
jgi:hypothetical protein